LAIDCLGELLWKHGERPLLEDGELVSCTI